MPNTESAVIMLGETAKLPGLVEISLGEETRLVSTTKEVMGCENSGVQVLSRGSVTAWVHEFIAEDLYL